MKFAMLHTFHCWNCELNGVRNSCQYTYFIAKKINLWSLTHSIYILWTLNYRSSLLSCQFLPALKGLLKSSLAVYVSARKFLIFTCHLYSRWMYWNLETMRTPPMERILRTRIISIFILMCIIKQDKWTAIMLPRCLVLLNLI